MEAIIIRANGQFKSKALNTATAGLAKAFQNIENGRKDACAILAKVEKNKSYKEDGFNSLAEYAETIGLEKSLAHKMENAGRLLISENPEMKAFADKTDFSKLAILSSADEKTVLEAVKEGKLSPESTQADVKAWKANSKSSNGKEKVLSKFEVTGIYGNGNTFHYDAIELENVAEITGSTVVKIGSFEFLDEKWTVYADTATGDMLRVKASKVKKEDKAKAKTKAVKALNELSKEDLIALAESMGMKISF